ncbi:MAG: HlyC/CorC family transporter [Bacteroidales bacterium]|nr:HlyC/CorC family transporter [Bacteroidales bacterium]MBK7627087.1 HlyC/CorC family transporter [Bacteroidales bacterium]
MSGILIILLAIILSAFFSGMEIAFIASNKLRIELDRKQGVFGSEIVKIFTDNPGQYIATMLIGNNISLVIYGLVFSSLLGPLLVPLFESDLVVLVLNTLISTAIILFVAEFLPKTIFIISPNFFLKFLSVPTLIFYFLFYPISKLTLAASNMVIRLVFRLKPGERRQENIVFSKVDLDHFVNLSNQSNKETEPHHHNIRIFQNALDFSNVKLRECMVPRTEIEAVDIMSSVEQLKEKFIATRYSRILVYQDTIDNITGYIELKDVFRNPGDIKSAIRKLAIVPETMPANRLLKLFVDERKNIALVVDEFGGTSGMVTIEDVLEEIVGDIEDEHDTIDLIEKRTGTNEYIFSGRIEIDYLNEKYDLKLPEEDDYETLAGMIMFFHGSIPRNNDVIRIRNIVIRVIRATTTRLELVNLKVE